MKRYKPVLYGCIEDDNGEYVKFEDYSDLEDDYDLQCQCRDAYRGELIELKKEVDKFFEFLDYTEETDSGVVFHPIQLSNVRVMLQEPVSNCLRRMKELAKE